MIDCKHCNNPILDAVTGQVMHPNCARNAVKQERSCLWCHGVIIKKTNNLRRFCSNDCAVKYQKNKEKRRNAHKKKLPKEPIHCIMCGNDTKSRRLTCSDECYKMRRKQINFNARMTIK